MRQTASPLKVSVPAQLQGHSDRAETVTLGLVRPFPQWLLFAIHGELRPAGFSEADLGPWSRLSGGHSTEGCAEAWRADARCTAASEAPGAVPLATAALGAAAVGAAAARGGSRREAPGLRSFLEIQLFVSNCCSSACPPAGQEEDSPLTAVWKASPEAG